jgi:uncharacterized protein (UPF0276 family)
MPEWKFPASVAGRAGCGGLLDLNDVSVNFGNQRFGPLEYLENARVIFQLDKLRVTGA